MPLVSFIKELGVPRAVLEKAIGKADDYLNESEYDLPYKIDLDLIYTLDNEKINAYYKYTPSDPWSEKGERKYRYCYYSWVIDLYEQFAIWDDAFSETFSSGKAWKLIRSLYDDNFRIKEEPDEMPLVTFIKTFEIPKENLDSLLDELSKTEKYKDFLKANAGTEYAELPNLDIIYTFDNKKINEYYSIDKPFNAETGEDIGDIIVFAALGAVSLAAVSVLAKKRRVRA